MKNAARIPESDPTPEAPARLRVASAWLETPLGARIAQLEREMVGACLPRLYNPICLQIGSLGGSDVLGGSEAALKVLVEDSPPTVGATADDDTSVVRASSSALPFGARSVDLAVLVHALDFSRDPHQVLREVDQILAPDGHIVIVGFNRYSLWGTRHLLRRISRRLTRRKRQAQAVRPWGGSWLRLGRAHDWLALLGYEITAGRKGMYNLPLQGARLVQRFDFLEPAGARWWPRLGAIYVVVARKRELTGTTAVTDRWKRKRRLGRRITAPVARDGSVYRLYGNEDD